MVLASIGIRGQGNALKRGFAKLDNVEIKTLCDIDANLFAARVNDAKPWRTCPTFKPGFQQDLRRVLDDKDIDGVLIATPNHWHALATIWALQAGKHVYVEKPGSHTVWEGRKMVEAAQRYGKIVQVGTMNRSRPPVRQAIQFIHDGGIGEVYMARGLCFKPRPSIGRTPTGRCSRARSTSSTSRPTSTSPPTTPPTCPRSTTTCGSAPRRCGPSTGTASTTTGTGTGTTATATPATRARTSSTSRAGDSARTGIPMKIRSVGRLLRRAQSSQETPTLQTTVYDYADGKVLEFATRGGYTNDEGTQKIGNLFYGTKGWVWIDGDGRGWQSYLGRKDEKGPGSEAPPERSGSDPNVLTSIERPHYQNFVDAIRAGDPKKLTCDILEGHLSASLPHLANISYRVGRALTFDGKTETFVGDREADKLLTRQYRKPFEIPQRCSGRVVEVGAIR